MKRSAHGAIARRNSRKVSAPNHQIGVTRESSVTSTTPKTEDKRDDRPRACGERVQPWLDLANGEDLSACLERAVRVSIPNPPETLREALRESLKESFKSMCQNAQRIQELERLQRWPGRYYSLDVAEWNLREWQVVLAEKYGQFVFDFATGKMELNPTNLYAAFRQALVGVDTRRFRQCPECSHFLYIIRTDQVTCGKANCRKKQQRSQEADLERQVFELFDAGKTETQVRSALLRTGRTLSSDRLKRLHRKSRSRQSRRRTSSMNTPTRRQSEISG